MSFIAVWFVSIRRFWICVEPTGAKIGFFGFGSGPVPLKLAIIVLCAAATSCAFQKADVSRSACIHEKKGEKPETSTGCFYCEG